jgi:PP-loop superfamily ATP-utilizing enzyme
MVAAGCRSQPNAEGSFDKTFEVSGPVRIELTNGSGDSRVTAELMDKIDRAEAALRALDFRQFRVRAFGEMARVELAQDEMARGFEPAMTAAIAEGVKRAGFDTVELDPEGYRQGSLNSLLKKH